MIDIWAGNIFKCILLNDRISIKISLMLIHDDLIDDNDKS